MWRGRAVAVRCPWVGVGVLCVEEAEVNQEVNECETHARLACVLRSMQSKRPTPPPPAINNSHPHTHTQTTTHCKTGLTGGRRRWAPRLVWPGRRHPTIHSRQAAAEYHIKPAAAAGRRRDTACAKHERPPHRRGHRGCAATTGAGGRAISPCGVVVVTAAAAAGVVGGGGGRCLPSWPSPVHAGLSLFLLLQARWPPALAPAQDGGGGSSGGGREGRGGGGWG